MMNFYPWCGAWPLWQTFRVIPTVYEQAMSYEEQILFIAKSVNDVIQQIDKDNQAIYDYINSQIESLEQSMRSYTDSEIAMLRQIISQTITSLTKLISATDGQNRMWTLGLIEEIKKLILENQPTVWITNPFTGGVDSIQNVVNQIVRTFRNGITAGEYDKLKLTGQQFEDYALTAYEYDFYAKKHLLPDYKHMMFDPWNGVRVPIVDVINQLVQLHKPDGMTAQLYTETDITANEYDTMTLDAREYDFNGKTILAHN